MFWGDDASWSRDVTLNSKDLEHVLLSSPLDLHRVNTSSQGVTQKNPQQMLTESSWVCVCVCMCDFQPSTEIKGTLKNSR